MDTVLMCSVPPVALNPMTRVLSVSCQLQMASFMFSAPEVEVKVKPSAHHP